MKHRRKTRIRWIASFFRWLDRRREWQYRPRITPYEASLFHANEEYKLRRRIFRTR